MGERMNKFNTMSEQALKVMSDNSDGPATYSYNSVDTVIDVVIDKDVEIINDDDYADNSIELATTATFGTMIVVIGASLIMPDRTWKVGRTLSKDSAIMTVIIS